MLQEFINRSSSVFYIVTRFRCSACDKMVERETKVRMGEAVLVGGGPEDPDGLWRLEFGLWFCPKHKIEPSIMIDGKDAAELYGYGR